MVGYLFINNRIIEIIVILKIIKSDELVSISKISNLILHQLNPYFG